MASFNHPKMWGDMPTGYPWGNLKKIKKVSIIRRCGGTCRPATNDSYKGEVGFSFNHPKMWGDMPTLPKPSSRRKKWIRFNHPKMWGDMPTIAGAWQEGTVVASFNHPKMWGDMPTKLTPPAGCVEVKFQSSEDVGGHADLRF